MFSAEGMTNDEGSFRLSKTCVGGCLCAQVQEEKKYPKAKLRIPSISGVFYFGAPRSELDLIPSGCSSM
jgi:hypothetical protein